MRTANHQSLLQIAAFIIFIINTQFTNSYASIDAENTINKLFETRGKENVVNFVLEKRNGNITIQKKKSFLNVTGRPDIKLVTVKSINHDLKNLNIDINKLETELDIFIENQTKKQQKKDAQLRRGSSAGVNEQIPLSKKLEYELKNIESKYKKSSSDYERSRLKKELSRVQGKYNEAKYNEKHNIKTSYSDNSSRNKTYKRSASYCNSLKSQLQELTLPSRRHQIFFCNDRVYRNENPASCGKRKYSKQYTLQEYKDKISKLRQTISSNCDS